MPRATWQQSGKHALGTLQATFRAPENASHRHAVHLDHLTRPVLFAEAGASLGSSVLQQIRELGQIDEPLRAEDGRGGGGAVGAAGGAENALRRGKHSEAEVRRNGGQRARGNAGARGAAWGGALRSEMRLGLLLSLHRLLPARLIARGRKSQRRLGLRHLIRLDDGGGLRLLLHWPQRGGEGGRRHRRRLDLLVVRLGPSSLC